MSDALADSKASLSSSIPSLNTRMTQHLTERSCRFLKSASEVPRLYRRTNKVREVAIMYTNVFIQCFFFFKVHSHISYLRCRCVQMVVYAGNTICKVQNLILEMHNILNSKLSWINNHGWILCLIFKSQKAFIEMNNASVWGWFDLLIVCKVV